MHPQHAKQHLESHAATGLELAGEQDQLCLEPAGGAARIPLEYKVERRPGSKPQVWDWVSIPSFMT